MAAGMLPALVLAAAPVQPDMRESLAVMTLVKLMEGDKYLAWPLALAALTGTDFRKQVMCASIFFEHPCKERRDCTWRIKWTMQVQMLGPVYNKAEWCENFAPRDPQLTTGPNLPGDPVPAPSAPPPAPPPVPSPPPPSPQPYQPPDGDSPTDPEKTPSDDLETHGDFSIDDERRGNQNWKCSLPGPACTPYESSRGTPPPDEQQLPIGGPDTRLAPPSGDDVGGGQPYGYATPVQNEYPPTRETYWLAKNPENAARQSALPRFVQTPTVVGEGAARQVQSLKDAAKRAMEKLGIDFDTEFAAPSLKDLPSSLVPSFQSENDPDAVNRDEPLTDVDRNGVSLQPR